MEVLSTPSISPSIQVPILEIQEQTSWMTPFIRYLLEGVLPEDKGGATKMKVKVYDYCIHDGKLHKKGKDGPNPKCLIKVGFQKALKELYEGVCGLHSRG